MPGRLVREREKSMFGKSGTDGYLPAVEGIERKTLVYGGNTLMTEFLMKKGSLLPLHAHPQEQTGYLVRGRIRLVIAGEAREMLPGDSWCIPGGAEHGAEVLQDSVAIEVFSPRRDDYLPQE